MSVSAIVATVVTVLTLGAGFFALALLVVGLYLTARYKIHASFVQFGTAEVWVQGNDVLKVMANIPGEYWDKKTGRLKKGEDPNENWLARWLRRRWGFYWGSILWPYRKLRVIRIESPDKLRSEDQLQALLREGTIKEVTVRHRVESQPARDVPFLFKQVPHPVLIRAAELKDGTRMDMLFLVILELDGPAQAALVHDGKFFPTMNVAVSSAGSDFARERDYDEFIKLPKGPSADREFAAMMIAINNSKPAGGKTVRQVTGFKVVDIYLVDYGVAPDDEEVAKAKRNIAIAGMELKAATDRARAEAVAYTEPITSLQNLGILVDDALEHVSMYRAVDREWDGVQQSRLLYYNQGGHRRRQRSEVVIPAPATSPPPAPPTP